MSVLSCSPLRSAIMQLFIRHTLTALHKARIRWEIARVSDPDVGSKQKVLPASLLVLLVLIFTPEDGGCTYLLEVSCSTKNYTAFCPRGQQSNHTKKIKLYYTPRYYFTLLYNADYIKEINYVVRTLPQSNCSYRSVLHIP
jgi:hypothetical protein